MANEPTGRTPESRVCLMMGDADAIKAYVFETPGLPEIRGGSQILRELEEEVQKIFRETFGHSDYLIYCGGGGFLAIVPYDQTTHIKQRIERCFYEQTVLATITVVYTEPLEYAKFSSGLPIPANNLDLDKLQARGIAADLLTSHFDVFTTRRQERKHFGEWVSKLVASVQQAKRQKTLVPFVETLPIHRRCDACGKRPSARYDEVRGEQICEICWKKRQVGRDERRGMLQDFCAWWQQQRQSALVLRPANDLLEMTGSEGRIAVLYADGNNMGELLQHAQTPEEYRQLSKTLSDVMREVVYQALVETVRPLCASGSDSARFEIIAIGGDDAILIVPLSSGWNLAVELVRRFEEHAAIKQLENQFSRAGQKQIRLTMSAGVAMADAKYPVNFLLNLAEGLLKKAKQCARKTQVGSLCHLWLRSGVVSQDADSLLAALYNKKFEIGSCWLTARPYTWQEAKKLVELAERLRQLPQSQRRSLAEALDKGVLVSLNYALYQSARHRQRNLSAVLRGLGELLQGRFGSSATINWFWVQSSDAQNHWQTALLDALELAEMGATAIGDISNAT